ncbi:MAG: hypothetical protein ACP5O8_00550 [Candidatus Aenigmatarchaeota archaeon]
MQAQVSLERISVYGWAIAIIMAMVFALYNIGLTKPCKFTGTQVSGFSGFLVSGVKMNLSEGKNLLVFRLTNNMENAVEIERIEMIKGDFKGSSLSSNVTLNSYGSQVFVIKQESGDSFQKEECYEIEIIINYYSQQTKHQSNGRIYGVVEN